MMPNGAALCVFWRGAEVVPTDVSPSAAITTMIVACARATKCLCGPRDVCSEHGAVPCLVRLRRACGRWSGGRKRRDYKKLLLTVVGRGSVRTLYVRDTTGGGLLGPYRSAMQRLRRRVTADPSGRHLRDSKMRFKHPWELSNPVKTGPNN